MGDSGLFGRGFRCYPTGLPAFQILFRRGGQYSYRGAASRFRIGYGDENQACRISRGADGRFRHFVLVHVFGWIERSRHIHLNALLMGQGMLEVKVECRRIAGRMVVDVRINRFRISCRPHFVQFILIGSVVEVIAKDGVEYIFVRFRQIVRQIQVVDEAQGGRLVFDAFLDAVDGTVAQIEGFMGFEAAVILAVLVEVVDAPFGVLVIELRAQEILSP